MTYKETKTGVKKSLRRSREINLSRAAHSMKNKNWSMTHKPYNLNGKKVEG